MARDVGICELCGAEAHLTKHHCVPQVKCHNKYKQIKEDESNIAWVCEDCHRTIHAFYTENELRDNYASVAALKAAGKFAKYLNWKSEHKGAVAPAKMANRRRK